MTDGNETQEGSFDLEFCKNLEECLDNAVIKYSDKRINTLAFDGILPPFEDKELSKKNVNDTRQIQGIRVLFLGGDAVGTNNTLYYLTLRLGKYALRRYAKGTSMVDCLPINRERELITIDPDKKNIIIKLK